MRRRVRARRPIRPLTPLTADTPFEGPIFRGDAPAVRRTGHPALRARAGPTRRISPARVLPARWATGATAGVPQLGAPRGAAAIRQRLLTLLTRCAVKAGGRRAVARSAVGGAETTHALRSGAFAGRGEHSACEGRTGCAVCTVTQEIYVGPAAGWEGGCGSGGRGGGGGARRARRGTTNPEEWLCFPRGRCGLHAGAAAATDVCRAPLAVRFAAVGTRSPRGAQDEHGARNERQESSPGKGQRGRGVGLRSHSILQRLRDVTSQTGTKGLLRTLDQAVVLVREARSLPRPSQRVNTGSPTRRVSRRGPLSRRRGDDPLRDHPADQPRRLRLQRAARPHGEGAGRPLQPDGGEGLSRSKATRSGCRST